MKGFTRRQKLMQVGAMNKFKVEKNYGESDPIRGNRPSFRTCESHVILIWVYISKTQLEEKNKKKILN